MQNVASSGPVARSLRQPTGDFSVINGLTLRPRAEREALPGEQLHSAHHGADEALNMGTKARLGNGPIDGGVNESFALGPESTQAFVWSPLMSEQAGSLRRDFVSDD
jgi:hypothetical protein